MSGFLSEVTVFRPADMPPVIVYTHADFLQIKSRWPADLLSNHLACCVERRLLGGHEHSFFIAIVWAFDQSIMVDFWGFGDLNQWSNNPDLWARTYRNGRPDDSSPTACGEVIMLLGLEEVARRQTVSLEEYLLPTSRPELPDYLQAEPNTPA